MQTQIIRDEVQGADIVVHVVGVGGPLVLVSHGTGGTPLSHKGLAEHLASEGFTVALVEHPGNKRGDDALAHSRENLIARPRHLRLVMDALRPGSQAPIGVIGHSMGGYSALAIAGGNPMALPDQTPDGIAQPVTVEHDARVGAVVLLAPALPWFMAPGALAEVRAPLLVRIGDRDELSPAYFTHKVLEGLAVPANVESKLVPNAGHFAFHWPIAPHLAAAKLPPALDPPGFDRASYQPQLFAEVTAFLRARLT